MGRGSKLLYNESIIAIICDLQGNKIATQETPASNFSIPTDGLLPGIYFITLITGPVREVHMVIR